MNNEQETVKPEALVAIIEELANTPMQLPMGRWDEISNTLILASRALAATQKLEAEKAELRFVLDGSKPFNEWAQSYFDGARWAGFRYDHAAMAEIQEKDATIAALRSQLEGMTARYLKTLSDITVAHNNGHFNHLREIVVRERAALTTQPQPAAGMEGEKLCSDCGGAGLHVTEGDTWGCKQCSGTGKLATGIDTIETARVRAAVNASCTCGGKPDDDPEACPACNVWHTWKANP